MCFSPANPYYCSSARSQLPSVNSPSGGVKSPKFSPSSVCSSSVQDWLHSLKLDQYVPLFTSADYLTLDDLVYLESSTLEVIGVTSAKHRKQLMNSIEGLRANCAPGKTHSAAPPCHKEAPLSKESAVHAIMWTNKLFTLNLSIHKTPFKLLLSLSLALHSVFFILCLFCTHLMMIYLFIWCIHNCAVFGAKQLSVWLV